MSAAVPTGNVCDASGASILAFGSEDGRGLLKVVVARSTVRVAFPTDDAFRRAVREFKDFSATLRCRPVADVLYGWGAMRAHPEDREIMFDVLWYDAAYFARRQRAYASRFHAELLARYGIGPEELRVTHDGAMTG